MGEGRHGTVGVPRPALQRFHEFLKDEGMPIQVAHTRRERVEAFIVHRLETRFPATAMNRYDGLRALFTWLVEAGGLRESPMARMRPARGRGQR